mgnify:CR=1 FL=1
MFGVRMPAPPLLLCDRVLGIEGPALQLGRGTIWTETDVGNPAHAMPGAREAWYLHDGHMRGGVFIEAGQADLLLASWQGMDVFHNRGERVYRLLGCELTYRGPLPSAGETLRYRCDRPHVIRNLSGEPARATMVCILRAAVME